MKEIVKLIIEQNPGVLNILISGLLLPVIVLWISNRHSRILKKMERNLELDFKTKDDIREQEKKVYASLSKILFDVQQLHVSLSSTCFEPSCIMTALDSFDKSVRKCHEDISDNMLYLSSDVINLIYEFYNIIGELKIELQKLDQRKEYDLANVTVYFFASQIAEIVIKIQELFIHNKSDLQIEFDKLKQEKMKYCCGQAPPKELLERYEQIRVELIARGVKDLND